MTIQQTTKHKYLVRYKWWYEDNTIISSARGKRSTWRYVEMGYDTPEERDAYIERIKRDLDQLEILKVWDEEKVETARLLSTLHSGENSIIRRRKG